MHSVRNILALALSLVVAACAGGGTGASSTQEPATLRRDRNVITREELSTETVTNVYDAIRHLRPEMLTPRGGSQATQSITAGASASDAGQINVYLDGSKLSGGVNTLRDISLNGVKEIRYLNSVDATQRYGTGNTGGAIVILSR